MSAQGDESNAEKSHPTLRVTLSGFLRDNQTDIIGNWTQRMRSISPARELSDAAIVDHLPAILTRISQLVQPHQTATPASLGRLPEDHAVDRLGRGFDLDQMVTEYGLLRGSILDLWESRIGPTLDLKELRALDAAFDEALRRATVRHAQTRERLLKALDRIAVAALGSTDLDTFLEHLLSATLETTESVDTAIVLLREGDTLRVRAAVGLEHEAEQVLSISKREGIAGQVAAEGQPLFIRDAASDPRMKSEVIRDKAVRALYTVPLIHEREVIGVAHIGSLTAYEFSDEDKLLFRTMASRATSVIVQGQLTANLRHSEETFRLAIEAAPAAIVIANQDGMITLVNTLTERLLGYELESSWVAPWKILCQNDCAKDTEITGRTSSKTSADDQWAQVATCSPCERTAQKFLSK
jgi:PAS domain-containing protein